MSAPFTLADGRTIHPGDEITVRWTNSLSGKAVKFRARFEGVRAACGSLLLYRPDRGHYSAAPSNADVTVHRKLKWAGRRKV